VRSKPEAKPPQKPRSRRPRRGHGEKPAPDWSRAAESRRTSQPTHREAYAETRRWLLAEHGPVCAYCERTFKASVMTLDHVAPRRGQSAYDRRDNLVLACPECNAAKRDMAPIAFLLARRSRAVSLLRYGGHLSPMLIDLARSLVPAASLTTLAPSIEDDEDSPYAD
jgi:5-methylcytosine-specific restriction endonuclease McrA